MRLALLAPAALLLAACGGGGENANKNILNATSQMDPAAAAAVENAVANGADPHNALLAGGQAATLANEPSAADRGQAYRLQSRRGRTSSRNPNRKDGTVPPDKMQGTTNQPGLLKGGREVNDQPSGGQR
jgi:hypothetical protein